jgi:amino acid adenylation domain-containing protein
MSQAETIHGLVSRQAAETPDSVAVEGGSDSVTYAELDDRSTALARYLVAHGVSIESHVGLSTNRTADMVVGALAILKAGAAYVPIDPTYPENRVRHMIDDSGTALVITDHTIDTAVFGDIELLRIDGDWADQEKSADLPDVHAENLAYTIYTSGSTGKPKGVQVEHGNVVNFLLSMQKRPGLQADDRLLAVTTLSFDIAVLELYLPLICGATVVLATRELAAHGRRLAQRLDEGDISFMQATPATWRMLLQAGWRGGKGLKALVGGEAFPKDITGDLLDRVGALWNMYGPTETTVWSTCYQIESADAPILIGTPIDNTTVYVVDEHTQLVADGQEGELLIGGSGVTRGYYERPELNEERYLEDTFDETGNGRLYRTGDLVRMLEDGNLVYLNRIDNQVKLRGFRIELGEIEAVVAGHDAVSQAVVVLRDDSGDPRLVAYVVNEGTRTTTAGELRSHAHRDLPEHMIPSVWVFIDEVPLTPNGKVDRNALPEPSMDRPDLGQPYVPPRSATEKYLAAMWRDSLGIDKIGTRDRFFDLGGNSIKAIQFVDQLSNRIGQSIAMPSFFTAPCIADFAQLLERDYAAGLEKIVAGATGEAGAGPAGDGYQSSRRESNGHEDLAIIGMAARLPGAADVEEFWSNLVNGVESRYEVQADDLIAAGLDPKVLDDPAYVPYCFPLDDVDKFDAAFFGINPREAQLMDPQHRLFLECCWTALEDAGYAPDKCDVPVGVFGGIARNAYHLHNISADNDLRNHAHEYHILLGNDKDFLATRVAYRFNLRGPAMTVQSACSASGTALHQAALSVFNGDCSMALVGGGRVMSPQKVGYHYVDGNVLSADGHVHAFDENASGMVRGSGMVVIAIKRLSDAVNDGDYIRAVIKSTAVNNDGSSKASFTAPSVPGQAEAIRHAMEIAGVKPQDISYVEAHGTGTRLGDPIEVSALNDAWADRDGANRFCPIGSSKTNVGHLDGGACVTGVIKTALSLEREQIPPSLNYQTPNPLIDFENSPFYVNDKLTSWKRGDTPRVAAVSSFGVGGTNAHVVMQEAPERGASSASRPVQMLPLSGRRPDAINDLAAQLCERLRKEPDINLADLAYTLQVGRSDLSLRSSVVVNDREDAIRKLEKLASSKIKAEPADESIPVIFMFPGQGSQHVDMAKQLFEHEAVFRVHVEHCARALQPIIGFNICELLYPAEDRDAGEAAEELKRTEIAQLALYIIEYSLAKVWQSWGVHPSSMIGHSIGEFVAATLAGVIELHDCLKIVHTRATLMGSMPPGDMMAIALPRVEVEKLLEATDVCIAASNAPEITVVSGTSADVAALRESLEADEIQTFPLHTSHAFHSHMMDPILEPLVEAFSGVALNPPKIPFLSSRTGKWITDEQATSPRYWGEQLRKEVRFNDGIEAILDEDSPVFLEVGPSTALSNSVRSHVLPDRNLHIISSLSSAQKPEPALETVLAALGQVWAAGVAPDWKSFYASEGRHRIPLPTYPFERVRHWLEPYDGWAGEDAVDPETLAAWRAEHAEEIAAVPDREVPAGPVDHASYVRQRLRDTLLTVTGIEIDPSEDEESFLELGFHSLLLTQISAQLRKEYGVSMMFRELIDDYASIQSLGEYMQDKVEKSADETPAQADAGEDESRQPDLRVVPTDHATDAADTDAVRAVAADDGAGLRQKLDRQTDLIRALAQKIETLGGDTVGLDMSAAEPMIETTLAAGQSGNSAANGHDVWRQDAPPMSGARLGRDPSGKPGWYVEDPEQQGKYKLVSSL